MGIIVIITFFGNVWGWLLEMFLISKSLGVRNFMNQNWEVNLGWVDDSHMYVLVIKNFDNTSGEFCMN